MKNRGQTKGIYGFWILQICAIFISKIPVMESRFDIQELEEDLCPGEGFFPDPRSCTKFYRCVETFDFFYAYEFECPLRTVFDPTTKVCNHPYAVHPDYRCFIGNLIVEYKVKEIIHIINDTRIHQFVRDSGEILIHH